MRSKSVRGLSLPTCRTEWLPSVKAGRRLKAIETAGLRYYVSELGVKHAIFTRQGGVSSAPFDSLNMGGTVGDDPEAVRRNHHLMYQALELNAKRACTAWLTHSVDVVVAHHPVPGRRWLARADGIITHQKDLPLVMRYADCTPLLYHDPVRQVIGIAHAGWRGTVQGMARRMVESMQMHYGSRPEDIQVMIGPSISQAHFQVGEEVVQAIETYYGTQAGLVHRDAHDGTAYVDLWEANQRDLLNVGVKHIEIMGLCTVERVDEFYSHRAERGKTGRFGAVIAL